MSDTKYTDDVARDILEPLIGKFMLRPVEEYNIVPNDTVISNTVSPIIIKSGNYYIIISVFGFSNRYHVAIPVDEDQEKFINKLNKHIISNYMFRIKSYSLNHGWIDIYECGKNVITANSSTLAKKWATKINKLILSKNNKINININLLLHGKPGTGKSKFAETLAAELNKSLYIVNPRQQKS